MWRDRISNLWDRYTGEIIVGLLIMVVLGVILAAYLTWRTEPGTVTSMTWSRTIEIQEEHTRTHTHYHPATKDRGSYTTTDTEVYWVTVDTGVTAGRYPEAPRWPVMRPLKTGWFSATERYSDTACNHVCVRSDLGKDYAWNASLEAYNTLKPGLRVMATVYFRTSVYNVVPLICEQ